MAVPRRHSKRERLRLVAKASPIAPTATLQALPDARGPPALADDLLVGARAISRFMFGTTKERRRVYWLVETGQIPTFRLGTAICARKSTILRDVARREVTSAELNATQA